MALFRPLSSSQLIVICIYFRTSLWKWPIQRTAALTMSSFVSMTKSFIWVRSSTVLLYQPSFVGPFEMASVLLVQVTLCMSGRTKNCPSLLGLIECGLMPSKPTALLVCLTWRYCVHSFRFSFRPLSQQRPLVPRSLVRPSERSGTPSHTDVLPQGALFEQHPGHQPHEEHHEEVCRTPCFGLLQV